MSVLVTGGAGYVGGHMTLGLIDAGEKVVVVDNLSTGFAWAVPEAATLTIGDFGATLSGSGKLSIPTIDNNGTIYASTGTLEITGNVSGAGNLEIANGATLKLDGSDTNAVTFQTSEHHSSYGTLVLEDPSGFTGDIFGFTGTAPDSAHSDGIDLTGFNSATTTLRWVFNAHNDTTALTATDSSDGQSVTLTLEGNYSHSTFSVGHDSNGNAVIYDPPAASTGHGMNFGHDQIIIPALGSGSGAGSSPPGQGNGLAGQGNDNFVFHSNFGSGDGSTTPHDTFNPGHTDTQGLQNLAAEFHTQAQHDSAIEFTHSDVSAVHALLQNTVHLH